jgi:anti-anti-sigma factor
MFAVFRRETAAARSAGYRGLRLVADMDWLLARRPSGPELAAFELLLDEVVTELGATVVCAYRTEHFDDATIAELVAVHPVTVGPAPAELGFRLWNVAPAEWELTGEIDAFNAEPFGRALTAAASGVKALRLRGAGLRFMAAAGIGAVIQVALARQDLRLVIEDVNATVQRCWSLLDLERALPGVELLPAPADGASPVEAR